MMLDLVGLPKNVNGFRTTHTCELCGFEPKTKNKYREKQDHLVMKHFKEKIDKIFPHCRPYACPAGTCPFTGKDKQALLRHYTGKHGILEKYLREALAEKGINYAPNENGKRRHSDSSNGSGGGRGSKNPRQSLTPPGALQQNGNTNTILANGNAPEILTTKQITLPTRPSAEDLRKEVEAMMQSLQPIVDQPVVLQIPSSAISTVNGTCSAQLNGANGTMPICTSSAMTNGAVVTAIPVIQSTANGNGTVVATAASTATVVPVASLPAIVLSAVANATAASIAANGPTTPTNGVTNGVSANGVTNGVTVSLPTQPNNVPTITVPSPVSVSNNQHQQQQQQQVIIQNGNGKLNGQNMAPVASLLSSGPSASTLPIPLDILTNGNLNGQTAKLLANGGEFIINGKTSNGINGQFPATITVKNIANGTSNGTSTNGTTSPSPLEHEDVMWSAVNSCNGPAVVVEAANTLPVAYVEAGVTAADVISFAASTGVNGNTNVIESIDYDYLYPVVANGGTTNSAVDAVSVVGQARERQLDFCML